MSGSPVGHVDTSPMEVSFLPIQRAPGPPSDLLCIDCAALEAEEGCCLEITFTGRIIPDKIFRRKTRSPFEKYERGSPPMASNPPLTNGFRPIRLLLPPMMGA